MKDTELRNGRTARAEKLLRVFLLFVALAAVLPYFLAIRYTIFNGDDFAFFLDTAAAPGNTHLARALYDTRYTYMTWQGTYTSVFAVDLLNPLNRYSWSMLRLELMGELLAVLAALFWLCREADETLCLGRRSVFLFVLLLFPVILYEDYKIYLEHTCSMVYELPTLLLCASLAMTLRSRRTGSAGAAVGAGLLLFLTGGGVLLIGGMCACLLMLLFVTDWFENGRPNKTYGVLFAVLVASDLLNVIAPGNYAKHSLIGGLSPIRSAVVSIEIAVEEYGLLLGHFSFLAIALFAFVLGWRVCRGLKPGSFAAALVILIATPAITLFPMMLGYSGSGIEDLPLRGQFVLDAALTVSTVTAAALIGNQLSSAVRGKRSVTVRRCTLAAACVLLAVSLLSVGDCIPVRIAKNLLSGKIRYYGTEWHERYDDMAARPGEDIILSYMPETCEGTLDTPICSSPEEVVNRDMAEYFGNNSICDGYYWYMHHTAPEAENK